MEKLELKHIAPYLPYKLMIRYHNKTIVMNAGGGSASNWIGIQAVIYRHVNNCKPILRPLSDLTKEIEVNGEKFTPMIELDYQNTNNSWLFVVRALIEGEVRYSRILKLLEWHFDIFGLIENGLAIDINTLK